MPKNTQMTLPTHIKITEFDLNSLLTDAVVVIIGRRRSGKSWLVREIMSILHRKGLEYGAIFAGTEESNPFYFNFFPSLFISKDYTEDNLAQIIAKQKRRVKLARKTLGLVDGRVRKNNMLLVFDDMLHQDNIWRKSQNLKELFVNGRHFNVTFYLVLQCVLGIPPGLRENIDYAFLFATDGNNLRKLWENYAGVIESFDMFRTIFHACTADKGCLVIDKTNTSNDITQKVFFYRARDPGPFRFGSAQFWRMHEERCRMSDDDDASEESQQRERLQRVIETYGPDGQRFHISFQSGNIQSQGASQ